MTVGGERGRRRPIAGATLKGALLVATPQLADANFERAVILMLEHTDDGAVGVVLNRPSTIDFNDPLPDWYGYAAYPPVVFVGGPVSQGSAIGLARATAPEPATTDGFTQVLGPIGTVDLALDPAEVGVALEEVRVFSGYAGWSGGQLEGELDEAAWWVVDSQPDDAMCAEPDDLWRDVLHRQSDMLALFANFPHDPALN
jgi:putative transcriptional regulator